MNARVKKKNGVFILDSSLRSVSTMLNRKINAVKVSWPITVCANVQ